MSSDKVKKELKELLKDPDNKYCADCPIKGPTWASVNIGVWICMPCSGIHRSLGTHITQVRSVDLDKWKPEWVEVMRQWGNSKANAVWEAKMPSSYDGRPTESDAQNLTPKLQRFIRDKYERKRWYSETAAAKRSGKKKASSDSEEEEESESESESEEEEVKPKKASSSSSNAGKKPAIVIKQPVTSKTETTKKKPVVDEPADLLETFDPFADSTFTSAPPAAAAAANSSNPFGDGFDDFMSAKPAQAASAPAPSAPASTPLFDLNALYGMSSTPAAHVPQQQPAWGSMPSASIYPPQPQQPQAMAFPGFPTTQSIPQQPSAGAGQVMIGGFSFPAPPVMPQQQQAAAPFGNSFPFAPQQQMPAFPPQQPAVGMQQQPQLWPNMTAGTQAAPKPAPAKVDNDPFSGLF